MLKRHKTLLGVLLNAPRIPSRIELMKWVFLIRQEPAFTKDATFYHFVPYKYGPFSFSVFRELEDLGRYGYLRDGSSYTIEPSMRQEAEKVYESLEPDLRISLEKVLTHFGAFSQRRLLKHVYNKYPWFASRSELPYAPPPTKPRAKKGVYTAGYEGESIDQFLGKLLKAGIKRIVDVRSNPVSRKYGFAKKTMQRLCENLDMGYVHLPELGIPPAKRRGLDTFEDYQKLMAEYERSILPLVPETRKKAEELLSSRPSALVCFEADIRCCHRGRLAKVIGAKTNLEIAHL